MGMTSAQTFKIHFNKEHLDNFLKGIKRHEIFLVAGSIAYTTALTLAPFVLIVLSLSTLLSLGIKNKIAEQVTVFFGDKVGETIKSIIENASQHPKTSGLSAVIGFLVLAASASAIVTQLRLALDKINEYHEPKKTGLGYFIKEKFGSVGLILGLAFLSIASLFATTLLSVIYPHGNGFSVQLISNLVSLLLFTFLFTAIYRFIPSDHFSWKRCSLSGFVSAVFYLIGKSLIGLYLAKAGFASAYGAAGSLVLLLVWVYYSAITLLISYEFSINLVFSEDQKAKTEESMIQKAFPHADF